MEFRTADPSRRALVAALAGGVASGLAVAAPARAAAKPDKKGNDNKAKPPLATMIASLDDVVDPNIDLDGFLLGVNFGLKDLRGEPGSGTAIRGFRGFKIAHGSAAAMQAEIVRNLQQVAAEELGDGLPEDRVAVLLF